jgi:hypothetical protein
MAHASYRKARRSVRYHLVTNVNTSCRYIVAAARYSMSQKANMKDRQAGRANRMNIAKMMAGTIHQFQFARTSHTWILYPKHPIEDRSKHPPVAGRELVLEGHAAKQFNSSREQT